MQSREEVVIVPGEDLFGRIDDYLKGVNNHNAHVEFEYRIKNCPKSMFVKILKSMKNCGVQPTLEQTSNALYEKKVPSPGKVTFIITKFYNSDNHKSGTITKHIKQKLAIADCLDFENIRLSVALEIPSDESPSNYKGAKCLYRIKNRLSFAIDDWQYDFTQSVELDSSQRGFNANTVTSFASSLFGNLAGGSKESLLERFAESCNNSVINRFEIEIEYIGKERSASIINTFDFLAGFSSEAQSSIHYMRILSLFAKQIGRAINTRMLSLKNILPNAYPLNKIEYNKIFPPIGWYCSYKADGDRAILQIYETGKRRNIKGGGENAKKLCCLIQTSADLHIVSGKLANGIDRLVTAIEGELMLFDGVYYFLAYDIIISKDVDVSELTFKQRLLALDESIELIDKKNPAFVITVKPAYLISDDIQRSFKAVIEAGFGPGIIDNKKGLGSKAVWPNDGYILTEPNKNYFNTMSYKIKQHNTIDFLAIKLPEKHIAKYPIVDKRVLYLLFCGTNIETLERICMAKLPIWDDLFRNIRGNRIPIQFSPSDNPMAFLWYVTKEIDTELCAYSASKNDFHKPSWAIVELEPLFTPDLKWEFHRIRDDRYAEPNYFGNDFTRVAIDTWYVAQNPVKIEEMHLGVQTYFNKGKSNSYLAQTSCVSYAKSSLLDMVIPMLPGQDNQSESNEQVSNESGAFPTIIDFAAGKGQDLFRYSDRKFAKGLFLDIDKIALMELVSRYYSRVHDRQKSIKMKIGILHQDLTKPADEVLKRIADAWSDNTPPSLIVCNLAIHYVIRNSAELINFVTIVRKTLGKGGIFMYTTFDGKRIVDLIGDNKQWISEVDGVAKYRIVKEFEGKTLAEFGQRIKVKLAFTGDELYEENLVNLQHVNTVFTQLGFRVLKTGHLDEFLPGFMDSNRELYKQLSEDDKTFIGLYSYNILQVK